MRYSYCNCKPVKPASALQSMKLAENVHARAHTHYVYVYVRARACMCARMQRLRARPRPVNEKNFGYIT